MVPRSPSELGSRYTIFRLQQNSLPTRCTAGIHPRHRATSGPSQSTRQECRPRSCCGRPGGRTPQLSAARRVSRSPSLTSVVPAPERPQELKLASAGWKPHLHMTLPPAASWTETANNTTLSPLCQARWSPNSNPSLPPSFFRFLFLASFWL